MSDPPEVRLVFPPALPMNELPELGMAQVAGALRDAGIRFAQHDLNAELLFDYLRHERFADRVEAPSDFALPARDAEALHAVRLWIEQCFRALPLAHRGFRMAEVQKAALAEHPVYDAFFQERFFDRVGHVPRVLGLSVMSSSQLAPGLILARMAKARWPDCFVVLGGPWACAARHVARPFLHAFATVDAVVPARGDRAVVALIDALRRGEDLTGVPNLVVRGAAGVVVTPSEPALALEHAATPCFDGLDLDRYPVRMLPVQTASRCHWGRCVFCYHDDERLGLTFRSAERVVDDLAALHRRHGVDAFFFADCATPLERMTAVGAELIRRGMSVGWSALARAETGFTSQRCEQLREGGCRALLFGLETSSRSELLKLRKGISPEGVASTVRACADAGIAPYLFVLDYPGQDAGTFERTLAFVVSLAPWLEDFIVSRFQLSEVSRVEEATRAFGIRRTVNRDAWLDVFDIPFDAPSILPAAVHEELVQRYVRAFFEARGDKPRRDPFLVGALGSSVRHVT